MFAISIDCPLRHPSAKSSSFAAMFMWTCSPLRSSWDHLKISRYKACRLPSKTPAFYASLTSWETEDIILEYVTCSCWLWLAGGSLKVSERLSPMEVRARC
jgi:hypothetical protein